MTSWPFAREAALLLLSALVLGNPSQAAIPVPRMPWTNSNLIGSPEPPLPYTVQRAFTNLTLKSPLYLIEEPGTDQLWVVLQGGDENRPSRVVRFDNDLATPDTATVLELPGRLIYSVCFHPGYLTNQFVFVFSNGPTPRSERTNRVARYNVKDQVDPKSELPIIEWRSAGHDGGDMAFGLDGMLYITTGDGTSDSDGWVSGQTLDDLLGSVLRIDVDRPENRMPYGVPRDNPFLDVPNARPEIWAYGLRNPWRMGIDRVTGHVWVGNNGQDAWETAHLVRRGENYGWSVYEGSHPFYLNRKRGPTPHVLPTIEHPHSEFRSLTGGVVYYGERFPELNGAYIYGDYSSGRVWGMKHDGVQVEWHRELADTTLQIAAFRVDPHGELIIVDHGSGLYHLTPSPPSRTVQSVPVEPAPEPAPQQGLPQNSAGSVVVPSVGTFPTRLSETGLFSSTEDHQVDPGLIPYSVIAPAWADGLNVERFMGLPGEARIRYSNQTWEFPDGTVLMQTLSVPQSTISRRIETRLLVRQQGEWAGYSYRWTADQTDADLAPKDGLNAELAPAAHYRFPSRTECMTCHSRAANFVLGITGAQLDRVHAEIATNQIDAFHYLGIFENKPSQKREPMVDPYDPAQPLEARARAYLHVNCAVCHVDAGGGNSQMELSLKTSPDRMKVFEARPQHDSFGLHNAMLVASGDPDRSVLLHRLSRRGPGQMPPLGSMEVDTQAVALVREWIAQLPPAHTVVREWTLAELTPHLDKTGAGRSFASGKSAFQQTGCAQCHRFDSEGGSVGPDLTGIGERLAPRELLEAIVAPSRVVADEYATYSFELEDGTTLDGRIEHEDEGQLTVRSLALDQAPVRIEREAIKSRTRSELSNMPAGMLNVLDREQILDLLAYLLSEGDPAAARFKTQAGANP